MLPVSEMRGSGKMTLVATGNPIGKLIENVKLGDLKFSPRTDESLIWNTTNIY